MLSAVAQHCVHLKSYNSTPMIAIFGRATPCARRVAVLERKCSNPRVLRLAHDHEAAKQASKTGAAGGDVQRLTYMVSTVL